MKKPKLRLRVLFTRCVMALRNAPAVAAAIAATIASAAVTFFMYSIMILTR